ncbi:glucosaminyl-phosphatidylinositol-acyltransferase PIGW-like [Ciona intestinalis]
MEFQDAWKAKKESFVSGLNGTSFLEVTVCSAAYPLCVLVRALVLGVLPKPLLNSNSFRYVLDFLLVIFPIIIMLTGLSEFIFEAALIVLVSITLYFKTFFKKKKISEITRIQAAYVSKLYYKHQVQDIGEDYVKESDYFFGENVDGNVIEVLSSKLPFLTSFRVAVNAVTCICILAVDFNVFPRRFAKAENFGMGILDLGVGSFVVSNALVSQAARNWNKIGGRSGLNKSFSFLFFQLFSSWPLFLFGFLRLASVKLSGYHEHVSEYGVHWNFFFTLAMVKVLATVILFIFPLELCSPLAVAIAASYQYLLSGNNEKMTQLIFGSNREGGLLMQNKEGIASCLGYLSLYFAGVQLGAFIFKERRTIAKWKEAAKELLGCTLMLWSLLHFSNYAIQPISRRLANVSYCIWILSQSTLMLFLFLMVDILTTQNINAGSLPNESMPDPWLMEKPTEDTKIDYNPPPPKKCLISAINRNQLLFFLLSNLMTGAVNGLFDTQAVSNANAIVIITIYAICVTFITWLLHMKQITIKMW